MTVHRTRLARAARPHPRHGTDVAPVNRSRASLATRLLTRLASDRGDVPGWVMITLMTAAIVVALWAVASDQLVAIFENALAPFLGSEL